MIPSFALLQAAFHKRLATQMAVVYHNFLAGDTLLVVMSCFFDRPFAD